jgi:hypothetical protein
VLVQPISTSEPAQHLTAEERLVVTRDRGASKPQKRKKEENKSMKRFVFTMLFCGLTLTAQTPKADPPKAEAKPPETATAAPAPIPVSDGDRADIREIQMRIKDLQRALQDAQQAMIAKIKDIAPKSVVWSNTRYHYELREDQQNQKTPLSFIPTPEPTENKKK